MSTQHEEVASANIEAIKPNPKLVAAMQDQLKEIRESKAVDLPIPKASKNKPKGPFFPKNRPLKGHEGLAALKKELEGK